MRRRSPFPTGPRCRARTGRRRARWASRIHDLVYRYPGEAPAALDGISIDIEPGGFVALVGPSGAGKSTLVEVILGLAHPDRRHCRDRGARPARVARGRARRGVLRAAAPRAWSRAASPRTSRSASRPSSIDRDRVLEVLRFAQLEEFVATLPDGIDTTVGKQADAFSGGQIQRIGLARALRAAEPAGARRGDQRPRRRHRVGDLREPAEAARADHARSSSRTGSRPCSMPTRCSSSRAGR